MTAPSVVTYITPDCQRNVVRVVRELQSIETHDHQSRYGRRTPYGEEGSEEDSTAEEGFDAQGDTESSNMIPLMRLYTAGGNRRC